MSLNKFMYTKRLLLIVIAVFNCLSLTYGQSYKSAIVSGLIIDTDESLPLPYVSVVLRTVKDSAFVLGTATNEEGRFTLADVPSGNYYVEFSFIGYKTKRQALFVGTLSNFLDVGTIHLDTDSELLNEVVVTGKQDEVSAKMDKKTFTVADNVSQEGGSVLQAMQNLPGVTVQDGKVNLRGRDKVTVLIDGKQTALTGFGDQKGLDNIPASAIERIEIINNPSAQYDANGNAGIINIIYKKSNENGFTGKVGLAGGVGALWVKKENLTTLSPQYQYTPKINPSLSLNYRKNKINAFFQGDYLYTETLNKNEFVTRIYDDGTVINQQLKRNRNTGFTTIKAGFDWNMNDHNSFTFSGLFGRESIIDNGEEPFFNEDYTVRYRMWQFLEDELKTTAAATASYQHKFSQPGHVLKTGFTYTFHREDEKYFFANINPTFTGMDSFKLLSDEKVADLTLDYTKPLKYGRVEAGFKFRYRTIPTNMQFFPGINSPIDSNAGGWATYNEVIPAVYGNYILESPKYEAEIGLRLEYINLVYDVNPDHPVYKSDGYNYTQPFPSLRFAYKFNDHNKLSFFYNRRVDRPNEVDIRIFPKYDDGEIIKVGNPALQPQFTNSLELGYKSTFGNGYFYTAAFGRMTDGTITRISTTVPGSYLVYAVFQNVDKSYNTGVEMLLSQNITDWFSYNLNVTAYYNQIDSFTVENLYPIPQVFSMEQQQLISGNAKLVMQFKLPKSWQIQVSNVYLAPDIIPQGKIAARFSLDLGVKKTLLKGKGEVYLNASDLLNTMVIKKDIQGNGFSYTSADYYETQVIRLGFNYSF